MKIVKPPWSSSNDPQPRGTKGLIQHEDWHAMVALLALGSLDAEGQRSVGHHLASGCTRCAGLLAIYTRVAAAFGRTVALSPPSLLGTRRVRRFVRRGRSSRASKP